MSELLNKIINFISNKSKEGKVTLVEYDRYKGMKSNKISKVSKNTLDIFRDLNEYPFEFNEYGLDIHYPNGYSLWLN
jgi:hypothetical protein